MTNDIVKNNYGAKQLLMHEPSSADIISIYRFTFTEKFMSELYQFSKIHQYDDRVAFQEAWKLWVDDNIELVNDETRRLTLLGYDGETLDKMYKSARYYFRKKSTEKKQPVARRKYVGLSKDFLESIDDHIRENMKSADYQPKTGFVQFCNENIPSLKAEIHQLFVNKTTTMNAKIIEAKIKKTYKNRYFVMVNK